MRKYVVKAIAKYYKKTTFTVPQPNCRGSRGASKIGQNQIGRKGENMKKSKCRCGLKCVLLFLTGACVYYNVEICFRGYSHWSMALLGGILFIIIGNINERGAASKKIPLAAQGLMAAAIITLGELIAGIILNVWLGLGIWDYSDLPFNFLGQVCLRFSLLWIIVGIIAVMLDDWLRYLLFGGEKPKYRIMRQSRK